MTALSVQTAYSERVEVPDAAAWDTGNAVTVANWFKQLISWVFIAGALLHSGILYMVVVFNQAWAVGTICFVRWP